MKPVLAYHVIFGAYGFWLPNDPRGSWSDFVNAYELYRIGGPATTTTETRSVARDPHDRAKRLMTKEALVRPAVKFTGIQARAIGHGFATYVENSGLVVWACSILPEHVHLVVGRSNKPVEQVAIQLKGWATRRLIEVNLHPFFDPLFPNERPPKCWERGEWSVFLDTPRRHPPLHSLRRRQPVERK